jgi:hypothetical protein
MVKRKSSTNESWPCVNGHCTKTFATKRGAEYHSSRYSNVPQHLERLVSAEDAGPGEVGGDAESGDSFEEEENFTTELYLEQNVKWPEIVDSEGNPTQAGFHLFIQTVARARRESAASMGLNRVSVEDSILIFMGIVSEW